MIRATDEGDETKEDRRGLCGKPIVGEIIYFPNFSLPWWGLASDSSDFSGVQKSGHGAGALGPLETRYLTVQVKDRGLGRGPSGSQQGLCMQQH